jgi:exopolysaccharide biosynthesis polyprenyl glycosylphosphotransferase
MSVATSESYIPRLYAEALARSRKQRSFVSRELFWRAVFVSEVSADFITCAASVVTAYALQLCLHGYVQLPMQKVVAVSLLHGVFAVLLLFRDGAYGGGSGLFRVRETERATRTSIQSLLLLFPASLLLKLNFPSTAFLICLGLTPTVLIIQKQLLAAIVRTLQARGYGLDRVVIYGKAETGKRITSSLLYSPQLGFSPVAVVGDDTVGAEDCMSELGYRRCESVQVQAGPITAALLKSLRCSLLIVAMPHAPAEKFTEVIDIADQAGATIAFLPNLATEGSPWAGVIGDCPLAVSPVESTDRWPYAVAKRGMDIAVSSLLLVLLCPFLTLIAFLIRVSSPGPALFVQKRVGRNGGLFDMYKFRSMFTSAPTYDISPTHSSDPRITRLGRFLRRTSLDELPQLINVFCGNMSLVGPRPEMPFIVERYNVEQRRRLELLPGITGLWQLSADRAFPIHENIEYDFYYMRNRNFFMDVAILIHTALFAARGGV